MCHLRCDRIIGREGLYHVVVQSSIGVAVQSLGVHKFLQSTLGNAVDAADQWTTFMIHLGCFTTVVQDTAQTADGLGALVFYKMNDRHYFHRLAFKMSESKEPTCAYASVSSLRYTVFTFPMFASVVS